LSASLFVKDAAQARFLSGGLAEAEALFGVPLPQLPPGERQDGREVYLVRFHAKLRPQLTQFLKGALAEFGVAFPELPPKPEARLRERQEYEQTLQGAVRSLRATDRRQGLANLFWLSTSREVVLQLKELEAKNAQLKRAKYSAHALFAQFYRRVDQSVRKELEKQAPAQGALVGGGQENGSLIDALFDDGLAFTEPGIAELDVQALLRENRRFRISADAFADFQGVLTREVERRVREGDKGLLARIARHAPGVPKEQWPTSAGALKLALNAQIMAYLLGDAWGTGSHLQSSQRLRAEAERTSPGALVDAFLEFVAVLKRFEVITDIRGRVAAPAGDELEDKVRRGLRLYEFGESAQVLNNAVNATVLFLDLRGFTKTSEGQISERDLTRELYAVFDAFVPHVLRFGGTVDKFLGDGMMIHYGTSFADPAGALNALRTAILCQESIHRLRREGQTQYKMGVSIHYGRVYLARFLVDELETQDTIIGRNVNLAGRLSSAAKKPMEEDETADVGALPRGNDMQVTVDAEGQLFNEGIAVSRAAFVQIEPLVELKEVDEGGMRRLDFFDPEIKRHVRFRYAGDAKFKGVKASFPVFEVDYEA
jgi:class 3 adenylate cyclase